MKFRFVSMACLCAAMSLSAGSAIAADHGDSPGVRLAQRLDINDVYAFQSPTTPANTVLVMTTNPVSGIISPSTYHSDATYDFRIDNTNDASANIVYRVKFGRPNASNVQSVSVFKVNWKSKSSKRIGRGSTGTAFNLTGGGQAIAGVFDDPFFFDLLAFRNGLAFSSTAPVNFFRGLNTNAIVLEIPSTQVIRTGNTNIGVWAVTSLKEKPVDRMGRPAINTVLVTSSRKDEFNKTAPNKDFAKFSADAISIIQSLGSSASTAQSLAATLFPDVLTFDTANSGGFLNGRKLADDVIDAELNLLSSGGVTTDFVDNDSTFSNTFPYLQAKNP